MLYELVCGVLDVESTEYKEENSLASSAYQYDRGDLTLMNGTVRVADDTGGEKVPDSTN